MELKTFIKSLDADRLAKFASECETTPGHIRNVMYGYRPCSPELAVLIEAKSRKTVTRQELRPDDWQRIWPELVQPAEA